MEGGVEGLREGVREVEVSVIGCLVSNTELGLVVSNSLMNIPRS